MVWVLLLDAGHGFSQQNAKSLKEQREKTLQEIQLASKLLEEMKGRSKASLQEISLMDIQMKARQRGVRNLEMEMELIEAAVKESMESMKRLDQEIAATKSAYEKMILSLYRRGSRHQMAMQFLSSEHMNQFYKRYRYTRIVLDYLKNQEQKLSEAYSNRKSKLDELTQLQQDKMRLANLKVREVGKLMKELNDQQREYRLIEKKLNEIKADIAEKERVAKKLDAEIRSLFEAERGTSASKRSEFNLTPAEKTLSGDFEKNRGRLPWPLQKGLIVGQYGEHNHPEYKSVVMRNDGIYLSTQPGEKVRCVFKGIVSRVFSIPGENYTVIVKHGGYYTLYHNLVQVRVKPGQSVGIRDELGTVYTDIESKETYLYFQVWNGTNKDNPVGWLAH